MTTIQRIVSRLALVSAMLFLAACDDSGSTSPEAPSLFGYSAYIQAHLDEENDRAFVGATLFENSRKITLVAGDMIVARHQDNRSVLKGEYSDMGFYSAWLDVDDSSVGVDFSIEFLPVEAREDRWYPADLAYVDNGPGEYVGELEWDVDFPLPVTIDEPDESTVPYHYAKDEITVKWSSQSADIDGIRINAYRDCIGSTIQVKQLSGTGNGQASIVVEDLFKDQVTTSRDRFAQDLFNALTLNLFKSIMKPKEISQCDVRLYVIAEYEIDLGSPFAAGNIVTSRSDDVEVQIRLFSPLVL